jgi:hypothetical protein
LFDLTEAHPKIKHDFWAFGIFQTVFKINIKFELMMYFKKDLQLLEMITTNGGKVSFEIKTNFMENVLHN